MKSFQFHLMPYPYLPGTDREFTDTYSSTWVDLPNELFDTERGPGIYQSYLQDLVWAEQVGLDGVVVNEHHQNAYGIMPSPNLIAAALSQITSRVKVAVLGNAVPLLEEPQKIAEEFAMLDQLLDGRFIGGLVIGTGMEYYSYGTNPTFAREKYREGLDLILQAWTQPGPTQFHGEHFQNAYLNPWPRPKQQPHPPIWVPGGTSLETMELCVDNDFTYCITVNPAKDGLRAAAQTYQKVFEDRGKPYNPDKLAWLVPTYVTTSSEAAEEEAHDSYRYFIRRLLLGFGGDGRVWTAPGYTSERSRASSGERMRQIMEGRGEGRPVWDDLDNGGVILTGSPEKVTNEFIELCTDYGVGHVLHLFRFGNLPEELGRRSVKMYAEECLPTIREQVDKNLKQKWPAYTGEGAEWNF